MIVSWCEYAQLYVMILILSLLGINQSYYFGFIFQAHNDLLHTYESKLTQFGVLTEALGQGPAGLVSAPT